MSMTLTATDRPEPCSPGPGLACTRSDHDHRVESAEGMPQARTPEGEVLCNECGAPAFWDDKTSGWWHAETGRTCFLVPEAR